MLLPVLAMLEGLWFVGEVTNYSQPGLLGGLMALVLVTLVIQFMRRSRGRRLV